MRDRRVASLLALLALVGCTRPAPDIDPPSEPEPAPEPTPPEVAPPTTVAVTVTATEDREALWARMSQAKLTPKRIDTQADIYSYLRLHPDGSRVHAYRYRETIDYGQHLDLVEIDVAAGGEPRVLADAGTDAYFLDYVGATLYASRSAVSYETHTILRFDVTGPAKPLDASADPKEVQWYLPTAEGLLFEREDALYALAPGGSPVVLLRKQVAELSDLVNVGKGRAIVGQPLGSSEEDEREVLTLVTWEDGFRSPTSRELYREDFNSELYALTRWTEQELIAVETHDGNGDGKTDYDDEDADTICALNIEDGTLRPLTGGSLNVRMLEMHPSGLLMYVHEDLANSTSSLRVRDIEQGVEHELGVVKGDLLEWSLSPDWTRIVYAEVLDTNGDGNHYNWEDQSRLYYADF